MNDGWCIPRFDVSNGCYSSQQQRCYSPSPHSSSACVVSSVVCGCALSLVASLLLYKRTCLLLRIIRAFSGDVVLFFFLQYTSIFRSYEHLLNVWSCLFFSFFCASHLLSSHCCLCDLVLVWPYDKVVFVFRIEISFACGLFQYFHHQSADLNFPVILATLC